jgi:hypothetical protein
VSGLPRHPRLATLTLLRLTLEWLTRSALRSLTLRRLLLRLTIRWSARALLRLGLTAWSTLIALPVAVAFMPTAMSIGPLMPVLLLLVVRRDLTIDGRGRRCNRWRHAAVARGRRFGGRHGDEARRFTSGDRRRAWWNDRGRGRRWRGNHHGRGLWSAHLDRRDLRRWQRSRLRRRGGEQAQLLAGVRLSATRAASALLDLFLGGGCFNGLGFGGLATAAWSRVGFIIRGARPRLLRQFFLCHDCFLRFHVVSLAPL